jgi:hypothetical protein
MTFILMLSSLAYAKDFPVDYMDEWQSNKIDLKNTEWIVSRPSPNRTFLVHSKLKVFALVTEHISAVPVEQMEEFFAGPFTTEALLSREKFLKKEEGVIDLQGGSATHEGVRYGGTSFKVAMNEGVARFYERMWSETGRLWHVSLVSYETADTEMNGDLNYLMEKISKTPVNTTSFFNVLIPTTHATDSRCNINETGEWRKLSGIIPRVKKETKCNDINIAAQNRGNGYGVKLDLSSLSGCSQGPAAAWNSMKEAMLSGLSTLANATEDKIKQYGCERLKPPQANGIWQSITNSFAMQSYTDCLSAAATSAMVSQAYQGIKATLSGIRDLYNWVKAGNNPWTAAVAMVSKEVNGFLCLNAAAQAKMVCEYATHYFIALGVVVATAATGGALAPIAGAGTAARVAIAVQRGVSAAKAFIATPYTVTRTIVRAPAKIVEHVAERRATSGLTVSSSAGKARAAKTVRAVASVRPPQTPVKTPVSTSTRPRRDSPTHVVREEISADELNARTHRESRQQTLDQEFSGRNINRAEAEKRISEIGIEDYLTENADKFSSAERTRLTALYKDLHPDGKAERLAQLRVAAGYTNEQRLTEASNLLGRPLSDAQKEAILKAHNIGTESGNGFFTYTQQEITQKGLALRGAGFSGPEIRKLMEKGITGSEAVLDRYDGIRASNLAAKSIDQLRTAQGDPTKVAELMKTYREQNQLAAQSFASEARARIGEGDKAYSLVNTGLSIERYIQAGDINSAMAMVNSGLGQGMTKEGILKSLSQRLTLDPNSSRPDIILQRKTFAQVKDQLTPKTVTPAPVVKPTPVVAEVKPVVVPEVKPTPVPEPVRAPAVAKVVSPREASNLANDYRLGQNGKPKSPELASQYYMQAGEDNFKKEMVRKRGYNEDSNYLGDRNVHGALTESLSGDGTVALKMVERLATETKGGHGLNEFISEMHELNAYSYKNNPQARANMMKIIKSIEENYKDKLYSPQQSMMRAWRSSNDW